MPHGGFVIRSGNTGEGNNQLIEFSLNLSSNPEFTSSVLIAYARAAHRLNKEGQIGAKQPMILVLVIFRQSQQLNCAEIIYNSNPK